MKPNDANLYPGSESRATRKFVYVLLITIACAAVAARIIDAQRVYEPNLHRLDPNDESDPRWAWPAIRPEPMPTFGSNDRARWATVRALVDEGTYVIGHRETDLQTKQYRDYGIVTEDGWGGIDRVLRPEPSSVSGSLQIQDFYSSKPPLLPTLMAGEYWVLKHLFGWSIVEQRWQVVRTTVLTFNLLPFLAYLLLLSRLLERYAITDWARIFVFAAGCFATFLTTFAITANNHILASCSALFALLPAVRILYEHQRQAWLFIVAGFFAGFTACNELPAASLAVLLGLALLWRCPGRTLAFFVPAAAIPVAAFFLTNYAAIGQWRPAYTEFAGPWYEYEGSFWKVDPEKPKTGIDWAKNKENKATYAMHLLIGHHGLFSLTPIFLLSAAGIALTLLARRQKSNMLDTAVVIARPPPMKTVALLTLVVSVVVIGFYAFVVESRNYGGWTSGPRWLMWLTPLFLICMIPTVDRLAASRLGRFVGYACLAVSVFSVSYPAWNPWRHPWLYNLMDSRGWIDY